jgi:hypothetical protein
MFAANNLLLTGSTGSGYQISRSVRTRRSASGSFSRTPATATNQYTWTWSGWIKRGALSVSDTGGVIGIFGAGTLGTGIANFQCYWNSDHTLYFQETVQNVSNQLLWTSTPVYRDPTAWYHIVVAVDVTQATASNRLKLYVNGVAQSGSFSVTPGTTQTLSINNNVPQYIGGAPINPNAYGNVLTYHDGYFAEVNFVDGQQLTPSSFGATDASTGVWNPIRYTGTYGTNGYYLPFPLNTGSTYSGSFNGSSQYLVSPSNAAFAFGTGDFTVEAWIKPTALTNFYTIFGTRNTSNSSTAFTLTMDASGTVGVYTSSFSPITAATITAGVWSHVAVTRSGTTARIFVDGILSASATLSNNFTDQVFTIGGPVGGGSQFFAGEISNLRVVKGTAVYTSNFAVPTSALTAISGTSLLTLQNATIVDNSTNAFSLTNNGTVVTATTTPFANPTIGADSSGNLNNWLPVNINASTAGTTYDSMVDTPTNYGTDTGVGGTVRGNYPTFNPLQLTTNGGTQATLSGGNLTAAFTASDYCYVPITLGADDTNPMYCEFYINNIGAYSYGVGILSFTPGTAGGTGIWRSDGSAAQGISGQTFTTGDLIGIAISGGTATAYKNGSLVGTISSANYRRYVVIVLQGNGASVTVNFGQRPFAYTAPSGYKALCAQNLPTPTILNGANYMAATTYAGSSGTQSISNAINGVSFQPDFVWLKNRTDGSTSHSLYNSVVGIAYYLQSNTTDSEFGNNGLSGFNNNGFGLVSNNSWVNLSGKNYIGWQWKGGGTAVTNTSGSISSQVSANPTAGFSIVGYTGTGTTGATVGHGLGVAPSMVIIKNRSTTSSWMTYHASVGNTAAVFLNLTNSTITSSTYFNNTSPTSTVFSIADATAGNGSGNSIVAYCFAAISGYSAFGSWQNNNSTSGTFVYTGFRPRFILLKNSDNAENWFIWDSARQTYNMTAPSLNWLQPNTSNAEGTNSANTAEIDGLSNGFKIYTTNPAAGEISFGTRTYIYAAFAENPFKIARAR